MAKAEVLKHPALSLYSALLSRAELAAKLGQQFGGDRDLYEALGYNKQLTHNDFITQYDRQDIAKAIIDRPVNATWHGGFEIVESDDPEETQLEKAWNKLYEDLKLRSKFNRLDRLTGLGSYGVLLLGLSDTATSADFVKPVTGTNHTLLYVKPFSGMVTEGNAQIESYEEDVNSERYGQPTIYTLNITNLTTKVSSIIRVHWTRVVHVAEGLLESEIEGVPRLEVVYNRLQDLEKIVGASAEMFWRGARPGYAGKLDQDFELGTEEKEELQTQVDEYEHNLRRILLLSGIELKDLNPQVSDPTNHVDVQIQMISAVTGIPKRILTGSERGELASSQDRDNWFDLVESRRGEFAEPAIIRPFVDVCIKYGILPPPKDDYTVKWKDLRTPSDKDKAEVGNVRATALKSYASTPQAENIVPPDAFYRFFLGLSPEDIELISEMKEEALAEEEQNPLPEESEAGPVEKKQPPSPPTGGPPDAAGPATDTNPPKGKVPPKGGEVPQNPKVKVQSWTESARAASAEARKAQKQAAEVRRLRAKNSYNPATKEKQRAAEANEKVVAQHIKGESLPDNHPFDVVAGKHAVEVKTIVSGKNPKITMHPDSLSRKQAYASEKGMKSWTVAIDARGSTHQYYVKEGVGSFRLSSMTKLGSAEHLARIIK